MSKFERTASCPKCGSVQLKVVPSFSRIDYFCSECNEYIETVNYDEYVTLKRNCEKCSNDTFKVRVTNDGKSVHWVPFCSKCNEEGSEQYIDRKGNIIDSASRLIFIAKDTLNTLTDKVNSLELNLNEVNNAAYYIEDSEFDETISLLKNPISECNDNASTIKDLVAKLTNIFNHIHE